MKPYGSELGPNHYFSKTIERDAEDAIRALAKLMGRKMGAEGGNA